MRHHPVTRRTAFEALADPTRRAVLDHLRRSGGQSVSDIAGLFTVSRPAISKHLRILHQARLVRDRRAGRQRVYRLDPAPLEVIDAWLAPYRSFWTNRLTELKHFVESGMSTAHVRENRSRRRKK